MRRIAAAACALLGLGAWVAAARPAAEQVRGDARCAGERWDVRNLLDADAASVDYRPTVSTVARLRSLHPATPVSPPTPRLPPAEFETFGLHTRLVAARRFPNGDTALVVGRPPKTLIVVFPDTHLCADVVEGPKGQDIHVASDLFEGYCGVAPTNHWQRLSGRAEISGVGFFAVRHAQPLSGSAPGGFELQPALWFSSPSCTRVNGRWP